MRFYFEVPGTTVFGVIHAVSRPDAQHQLMNGRYAHLYGQVRWLEASACGDESREVQAA